MLAVEKPIPGRVQMSNFKLCMGCASAIAEAFAELRGVETPANNYDFYFEAGAGGASDSVSGSAGVSDLVIAAQSERTADFEARKPDEESAHGGRTRPNAKRGAAAAGAEKINHGKDA
jgi:hypothetical protein